MPSWHLKNWITLLFSYSRRKNNQESEPSMKSEQIPPKPCDYFFLFALEFFFFCVVTFYLLCHFFVWDDSFKRDFLLAVFCVVTDFVLYWAFRYHCMDPLVAFVQQQRSLYSNFGRYDFAKTRLCVLQVVILILYLIIEERFPYNVRRTYWTFMTVTSHGFILIDRWRYHLGCLGNGTSYLW